MDTRAQLNRLIAEQPRLNWHLWEKQYVSWGIQSSFLEWIYGNVKPGSTTLETGAGFSTVVFAILGCKHSCLAPEPEEHKRIGEYCEEIGASPEGFTFMAEGSAHSLATLPMEPVLDFALIDGAHAFPMPCVDFFYINRMLKIGGMLAIDDLQIPSVGMMHKYLLTDPAYEVIAIDSRKTGIYRKVTESRRIADFDRQPMNAKNPDYSFLGEEPAKRTGLFGRLIRS